MAPVELHYEQTGDPQRSAVVLTHALGTVGSMWDEQARQLARDHRVVQLDLRGHGLSPSPAGPYSIAELGMDIVTTLDALGIERAHFGGVSLGGMISLWVAANHPDRVDRLAVVCSAAYLKNTAWWLARAVTARSEGMEDIAADTPNRWFTPAMATEHPLIVDHFEDVIANMDPEGYAGCCEAIAGMDLRPELSRVTAPTLVVAGADDIATAPELGRLIADGVADGSFVTLSRAAHLANVERAPEVTELLLRHFESA